jgi:hypothetical protein
MAEQLPSEELLADMRRKYMHAKAKMVDGDWLKGEPITAKILERWIPLVEGLQQQIYELRLPHTDVLRLAEVSDDGVNADALLKALCKKVESQRREIERLHAKSEAK